MWRKILRGRSSKPSTSTPPPAPKPDFWRIRNIKFEEKEHAETWLREQAKALGRPAGQGFSLAADSERTFCATLISRELPIPPNLSWCVDKDFIGFTPLSDPEDANVDIIVVTGLGGHALGSFRSQDGMSVWLRDFAPEDVPRARFVTYGYDTAVIDSDSNEGIHELASTLLDGLVGFRRDTQTRQRPLCFVCHSLGGVVLKEALVISSNAKDPEHIDHHEVMLATSGLVLMGVPNLGLKHDQLRTVVNGKPNENFVTDLITRTDGEPTQYLTRLTQDFARLCGSQQQPWRIVSYYERLRSPTLSVSKNGEVRPNGPKEFMVTKYSAERISDRVRDIDHLSSNADHRGLVRFDHARDARYLSLIRKIREIAAHASEILSAPVQSDSSRGGHFYHAIEPVKYFVPRVSLENQIKRRLHDTVAKRETSPKVLTIYGLGGAGKSQLVLSYVRTFRRDYSSVFIIDASTKASIELDYQQIYRRLHDPKASETIDVDQAINASKSWFDGRDERCLVVFDSADNMHDSHAADFFKLDRYLPTSSYLDVIITTRPQPTKGFSELEAIEVAELSSEEGVQLFLSYSGTKVVTSEVTKEVTKIVTKLGHFALAITLAGAWVAATPHKGIKDYLPDYRKRRSAFLSQKADSNAHQYDKSVLTTWEMSYEAVSEQCPAAANMLSFLAFLDNSDIFLQLLNASFHTHGSQSSDRRWQQTISPDMPLVDAVDEVFSTLAKYSLVKWNNDTGSYSMHKLVHAWGHDRLAVQARAKYGAAALECLATTSPYRYSDPMLRARLTPHIMANFSTIPGWFDAVEGTKESTLWRICLVACHLRDAGLYTFEKDLRVFELEKREDPSLEGDPELFRAMSQLASVLQQLGMYEEAAKLHRRALEGREKVLGEDDPYTLTSVNGLAVVLQIQGDSDAAVKLHRRALEGREKILGNEHHGTLESLNNLASVLQDQGDLDAAEKLYRRALEGMERLLGKEHPKTLVSVHNLASVLQDQGYLDVAEKLCRRALKGREKVLGKEHPETPTGVHNLASVLQSQGEYIAAEERLRQALEGREKVLGKEHPITLSSVWCLAVLMEDLGRPTDALPLYERAVTGFGAVLGSDHSKTVRCERYLRRLQQKMRDAQELDHSPAR